MIRSMTGFGEAAGEFYGVHYFLEIRSLNNRYFKGTIRLPEEFQGLEAEIESQLRQRISRGSVTVTGSCSDPSASAAFVINHQALSKYIEQIAKTPQFASGQLKVEIGPLLTLPGVLQPPADEEARLDHAREAFLALLDKATTALHAMRSKEGDLLKADLRVQQAVMKEHLAIVKERTPSVVREYEARLKQRVLNMIAEAGIHVEAVDLIREIAIYAEKTDISEEITRLTGHIEAFDDMLRDTDTKPVGRTLDFLAQEMLREANTMASKSNDVVISRSIVVVKGAIDRIKEQAANIE